MVLHLDAAKSFPLPGRSFELVFSEHMIEHVPYQQAVGCCANAFRYSAGRKIRIYP
jgi:hypothetical protein